MHKVYKKKLRIFIRGRNHWVTVLSTFGALLIIAKFIHYGCHKVEKQRSKSSLGSKTKQNPITKILSTKESPREIPVGRRFSWFTGNTLRRETVRKNLYIDKC